MNRLAAQRGFGRQLRPMSKDRKDVYLGDGLRRALQGRKESLSTSVNLIADRYQAIVERYKFAFGNEARDIMRATLAETRGHRLEGREIATFPALVTDWMQRNLPAPHLPLYIMLTEMPFVELVALVDWLERQP